MFRVATVFWTCDDGCRQKKTPQNIHTSIVMDETVKHSHIKSHTIGLLWFLLLPFDIIENWVIFERKCEGEQNAHVKLQQQSEACLKCEQMEIQAGWKITAVYCMSYSNLNIKYKC